MTDIPKDCYVALGEGSPKVIYKQPKNRSNCLRNVFYPQLQLGSTESIQATLIPSLAEGGFPPIELKTKIWKL
jgi:hypothetical protein